MGLLGEMAAHRQRMRASRVSFRRPFIRIVDTPWPKVAAAGILVLVASAAVLLVAGAAFLVLAMTDDTLGMGLLLLFGPVVLAGILGLVPVIGGMIGLASRAWNLDGSARIELGLVAIAALMLLGLPYLATFWWPLVIPGLSALGVLGLAVWPSPWREPPTVPLLYSE